MLKKAKSVRMLKESARAPLRYNLLLANPQEIQRRHQLGATWASLYNFTICAARTRTRYYPHGKRFTFQRIPDKSPGSALATEEVSEAAASAEAAEAAPLEATALTTVDYAGRVHDHAAEGYDTLSLYIEYVPHATCPHDPTSPNAQGPRPNAQGPRPNAQGMPSAPSLAGTCTRRPSSTCRQR